eukprot:scaffold946_cov115-Isochrysis_galbana.AAC.5
MALPWLCVTASDSVSGQRRGERRARGRRCGPRSPAPHAIFLISKETSEDRARVRTLGGKFEVVRTKYGGDARRSGLLLYSDCKTAERPPYTHARAHTHYISQARNTQSHSALTTRWLAIGEAQKSERALNIHGNAMRVKNRLTRMRPVAALWLSCMACIFLPRSSRLPSRARVRSRTRQALSG